MAETRIKDVENDLSTAAQDGPWMYPERLKDFLEFTGMSCNTLATKSGTPVSTIRKILQGETHDPRISTLQPILKASGADANIVLGLSPARDYSKDLAREGTMLATALQKRIEDGEAELSALRKIVLEKSERASHAEGRVSALEYLLSKRDETILQQTETIAQYECRMETKRHRIEVLVAESSTLKADYDGVKVELAAVRKSRDRKSVVCKRLTAALCIVCALLVFVSAYAVWEIRNIDRGITAGILEEYIESREST